MCTAVSYKVNDLYFGRTFDYEASYGEEIVFMPRKYPFNFRYAGNMQEHFAIIGMAHMAENIPLYYDAMNEKEKADHYKTLAGNLYPQQALEERWSVRE